MKSLTIGQVASRSGVGVETIRFYEREGLLKEPRRKHSGYRQYEEQVIDRIRFIRRAKELGFSLNEIKELLSLHVDPTTSCVEVKSRAEQKILDIEEKIRTLQKMRKALEKLIKACTGKGPIAECPILEALDRQEHAYG